MAGTSKGSEDSLQRDYLHFKGHAQSHKAKMAEEGSESKLSKVESVFLSGHFPLHETIL